MRKMILAYSLLLSFVLTACVTRIEAENEYQLPDSEAYYLPSATIGKPYRQIIHIHGSVPRTIWVSINPDNNGLQFRYLWSDPAKTVVSNRGDMIEISGIPGKENAGSSDEDILVATIESYGHQDRSDNDLQAKKKYYIKLIPQKKPKPDFASFPY